MLYSDMWMIEYTFVCCREIDDDIIMMMEDVVEIEWYGGDSIEEERRVLLYSVLLHVLLMMVYCYLCYYYWLYSYCIECEYWLVLLIVWPVVKVVVREIIIVGKFIDLHYRGGWWLWNTMQWLLLLFWKYCLLNSVLVVLLMTSRNVNDYV